MGPTAGPRKGARLYIADAMPRSSGRQQSLKAPPPSCRVIVSSILVSRVERVYTQLVEHYPLGHLRNGVPASVPSMSRSHRQY